MRKLILPLISLFIVIFAASCGTGSSSSSNSGGAQIRDDVAIAEISDAIETRLTPENLVEVPESYLKGMKFDLDHFDEYIVKINAFGANIDEYGIFRIKDGSSADDARTAVDAYLQFKLDSWMEEYMPLEKTKLENAKIHVTGSFIMYAILGEDERNAVFDEFNRVMTVIAG